MSAASPIGRTYDPVEYPVERAAVDAYVAAVGEDPAVWGEIAPPMFAVVYAGAAMPVALLDPGLGIDFARLVHGSQGFTWPGPVVRVGDRLSTRASFTGRRDTAGLAFFAFATETINQDGAIVCRGVWTNIVRGPETGAGT